MIAAAKIDLRKACPPIHSAHAPFHDTQKGKALSLPFPTDFLCQIKHNILYDIKPTVIKCSIIALHTGIVIPWFKKHDTALFYGIFPVPARKSACAIFHESDYIMLMEVIGKWLYNSFKMVCFKPQPIVIYHCPCFLFHVYISPCHTHFTPYYEPRLVKYLHFALTQIRSDSLHKITPRQIPPITCCFPHCGFRHPFPVRARVASSPLSVPILRPSTPIARNFRSCHTSLS